MTMAWQLFIRARAFTESSSGKTHRPKVRHAIHPWHGVTDRSAMLSMSISAPFDLSSDATACNSVAVLLFFLGDPLIISIFITAAKLAIILIFVENFSMAWKG